MAPAYQPPPSIVIAPTLNPPYPYQLLLVAGQEVCRTSFTGERNTGQKQLAPYATRSTHDELLAMEGNNVQGRWEIEFGDCRPTGHFLDSLLVQSR